MNFKSVLIILAATPALLFHSNLANSATLAKYVDEVARGRGVAQRPHNEYSPRGVNLGSFRLYPKFVSENVYNDNIFYSNTVKRDDFIFHLRPSIELNSNWSKHALDLSVVSDIAYHATFDSEDWQDYFINLSGRFDVEGNSSSKYDYSRTSFATAKFYNGRLHESRGDPDGAGGIAPVIYFKTGGIAGYEHRINRVKLNVSNETYHLDFENGTSILNGAIIPNDLRDRLKNISTLRIGYEINPAYEVFLSGEYNFMNYDSKFDQFGLERSSIGYQVVTGVALDFTGKLIGDAYIGYVNQNYDDARLATLNEFTGGFSLTWLPTGLTTVTANLDRIPTETTQGFASGSMNTSVKVSVDHELLRNLILNVNAGYGYNQYIGSSSPTSTTAPRDDDYYTAGISAKYLFNRNFYLKGGYDYSGRTSNVNFNDFNINVVYLIIGLQIEYSYNSHHKSHSKAVAFLLLKFFGIS